MKHTAIFAAPYPLRAAGRLYLMAPATLRDHAFLHNVLAEHFGVDPDGELEVALSEPDAIDYLASPAGFPFLLWVATHELQPALTIDDARVMCRRIARKRPDDFARVINDVFAHVFRQSARDSDRYKPWRRLIPAGAGGQRESLGAVEFGPIVESPVFRSFGPRVVGGWTLDQFEAKASGGKVGSAEFSKEEEAAYWRFVGNPANRPEMIRLRDEQDEAERAKDERKAVRLAARAARQAPTSDGVQDPGPTA